MTLEGIDVSQWNAATPPLVGQSFAFARASYGTGIDTHYAQHAANIRKAGIVLGAYAFGVFSDGPAQAAAFLEVAHDADLLVLDQEVEPGKTPMSDAQARAFIVAIHSVGRKCGLYHQLSGYPFLGQDWDWVAAWGNTPPARKWDFWQYQGTGIDRDRYNGTLADLHALASIAGGEVVAVTDPTPKIVDLALKTPLYAPDGTPLTTIQSGGTNLYSPFGNGTQRAVVISTGGVRQVALVALAACKNIRPWSVGPSIDVKINGISYIPTS